MKDTELKKEIEHILRYHKTPDGYVHIQKLHPKVAAIVRLINANYDSKKSER